jgi:hypothetical protein
LAEAKRDHFLFLDPRTKVRPQAHIGYGMARDDCPDHTTWQPEAQCSALAIVSYYLCSFHCFPPLQAVLGKQKDLL